MHLQGDVHPLQAVSLCSTFRTLSLKLSLLCGSTHLVVSPQREKKVGAKVSLYKLWESKVLCAALKSFACFHTSTISSPPLGSERPCLSVRICYDWQEWIITAFKFMLRRKKIEVITYLAYLKPSADKVTTLILYWCYKPVNIFEQQFFSIYWPFWRVRFQRLWLIVHYYYYYYY